MSAVPLKDICLIKAGQSAPQDPAAFGDHGYPFIRAGSLEGLINGSSEQDYELIPQEKGDSHRLKLFPKDTILFAKSGMSAKLGRVYRLKKPAYVVSHLAAIIPGEEVDPSYLQRWFEKYPPSRLIPNEAYPSIKLSEIGQLKIDLPPLPEQKRIAAILDKADAIRRKRQQAIKLADDFLRATFLDMFGDPVTNPKGWEVKELRELISIQGGYAFKSVEYVESGIPLVRIGNANKGKFDFENIAFLPEKYRKKYSRFVLTPGDLVITLTGTVGKGDYGNIVIIPDEYDEWLLNQRVAKIVIESPGLTSGYFSFFLRHPHVKNNIIKNSRGIRQANLNNEDILSQRIQMPSLDVQNKFNHIIKIIENNKKRMQKIQFLSANEFNSLTQRAFRGEL